MAKASTKRRKASKTKKEQLDAAIAEAVGAGEELHLDSVDFSDPQRPKTCLEVDFPILPINHVAVIEGNAGKPIYQMSKWWARRRSSVFRAMLIAGATRAPDDPSEAARLVWDSYYGNHQKNEAYRRLKVADVFMGGGTTIVEGCRLGMQMFGNDLNPVAWFVVKNELAQVDASEVQRLLDYVQASVKPRIMPFFACDCPRGHTGTWRRRSTGMAMGRSFDPIALTSDERLDYEYEGPEVIYTFWSKHGPCQATGCNHRTPIMATPVLANKTLTVTAWLDHSCSHCSQVFDIEQHAARMAPAAMFVCADTEKRYAVMDDEGQYECPHCGSSQRDEAARLQGESSALGKGRKKSIDLTLLVHPEWLRGAPGTSPEGKPYGGSVQDDADSTAAWHSARGQAAKLIEVRGSLPEVITVPDTQEEFFTDKRGGTIPRQAQFQCREATCGLAQEIVISVSRTGKSGPVAPCAIQGFCPQCKDAGYPYDGRFFASPHHRPYDGAQHEWADLRDTALKDFWPRDTIPLGHMTPVQNDLPAHGYPDWWCLFNNRQLLVHATLLKTITEASAFSWDAKEAVLGGFQQYLRNQNQFCFWDISRDCLAPFMSNNNYHPKVLMVENSVFSSLGRGNWLSCVEGVIEGLAWRQDPWEIVALADVDDPSVLALGKPASQGAKTLPGDPVFGEPDLRCGSSSALDYIPADSFDLVLTDPPFGGLLHYSELSDFFYAWLRLPLKERYPSNFGAVNTPKALEAVSNKTRHPDDHEAFYQRILTQCWAEARRILKPAGILSFTFHHSEDEPWVAVLESLFDAGFYLEATYPIRSDETKGEGQFGSKQIEFDIIHVCRKRVDDPQEISWARLRRQILQDVQQLQVILEHHQKAGLQQADLQVIRRGKALEYFSKHYGKVYIEKGREFTVREALAGINQLLDDQQDAKADVPPVDAEPYTRQFLRLFADTTTVPRDQMQKYLRGTGIAPTEFEERGWCKEVKKVFHLASPLAFAQQWKGKPRQGMGRDFDQAMFLIGGCFENSGIRVHDTLNSERFEPHVATGLILEWFTRHGGDAHTRDAAKVARQIYSAWEASNDTKVKAAQRTFDFVEGD